MVVTTTYENGNEVGAGGGGGGLENGGQMTVSSDRTPQRSHGSARNPICAFNKVGKVVQRKKMACVWDINGKDCQTRGAAS